MSAPLCIWCCKPVVDASVEHIVPDALACPPDFVLRHCVCKSCNNGLGHIDQALLHEFEIMGFTADVPRKGGKKPSVGTWASVAASHAQGEKQLHLNADKAPVMVGGKKLAPSNKANGITDVSVKEKDGLTEIKFSQDFGRHPHLVRALYKVAFGALAFFGGAEQAPSARYDGIRAFVKNGAGSYRALMQCHVGEISHEFGRPYFPEPGAYEIMAMTILGVSFLVDFDPKQQGLAQIQARMPAVSEVTWITLGA